MNIRQTLAGRFGTRVLAGTMAIVLATATFAAAQPGRGGWRGGQGGPGGPGGLFGIQVQENLRALGLSEEQRQKVRTIMETHRKERGQWHSAVRPRGEP